MKKSVEDKVEGATQIGGDNSHPPMKGEEAIIQGLVEAVRGGQPWHMALLEAIGKWTLPEEEFQGRRYCYLILGEAFDWVLLAERLCSEMDGLVPLEELEVLLFGAKLPIHMTNAQFKDLVGFNKYRAFLNYWYGVVVEEALQLVEEEEIRKRHRSKGLPDSEDLTEEAFVNIYGDSRTSLLRTFWLEMKYSRRTPLGLSELREFTYWLFKSRVKLCEPARVASDTRKGLQRLTRLRGVSSPF